jgi:hypothetical protein
MSEQRSRVPDSHHARSHASLTDGLARSARAAFLAAGGQPAWDPTAISLAQPGASIDLGRGLLDAVSLALHVLWTYQQAWAEEGFLSTARLPGSLAKLLSHLGYQGGPGAASTGLQHLHAKAGVRDVLIPAGIAVSSAPKNGDEPATYETLAPVRLDTRMNECSVFMPKRPGSGGAGGGAGGHPSTSDGEPKAPAPSGGLFGAGSAAKGVEDRIDVQRHGAHAARKAARARQDARQLASMISKFGLDGMTGCKDSLDSLCEKLCAAQKAAADAGMDAGKPAPLSESQEILARLLRNLARRQKAALAELECAMKPFPGEDPKDYAKRLDCLTAFLDALIAAMIQEARDQIVLLRGPGALDNLDRAFGADAGRAPPRGWALPGGDFLYLLAGDDGDPPVRAGDWLVVAENAQQVAPDGSTKSVRAYREAIRVTRVSREVPPGTRKTLVRIRFTPALTRRYRLDDVVLLGNMAPISEGRTVVEELRTAGDARVLALGQGPVTWLRDNSAPGGRRPEVAVTVDGRPWQRVTDLLAAAPHAQVFACEAQPGGRARLRFGDGENGAPVRAGARVVATYRIGLGAGGDRAGGRIAGLATAHPAIESTFNPLPTSGGADPEPAELARQRGPASLGALDRAASVSDVQVLARDYDGVRRAHVFRDPRRPRALTVVVSGPRTAALPAVGLAALRAYLAVRVPPGVDVAVENRTLVPVRVRILVKYKRGADPIALIQDIRERLGVESHADGAPGLLDPERVRLGDDLELSEIYAAVDGAPGLFSIVVTQLHRASERRGLHERIIAGPRQMLVWAAPDPKLGDGVELEYEEGRDL